MLFASTCCVYFVHVVTGSDNELDFGIYILFRRVCSFIFELLNGIYQTYMYEDLAGN